MSRAQSVANNTVAFLAKVYAWLLAGLLFSVATGWYAMSASPQTTVTVNGSPVHVPALAALMLEHGFLTLIFLLGVTALCAVVRHVPVINGVMYFVLTGLMGVLVTPSIILAQVYASHGQSMTGHPVRDAAVLTGVAFMSLSSYVLVTGKDFSGLGSMLFTGLLVLIGALVLGIFFDSRVYELAVSSVAVILFSLYILYDTSRILYKGTEDSAVGHALSLYLDVLNLFLHLLRIFEGSSKD